MGFFEYYNLYDNILKAHAEALSCALKREGGYINFDEKVVSVNIGRRTYTPTYIQFVASNDDIVIVPNAWTKEHYYRCPHFKGTVLTPGQFLTVCGASIGTVWLDDTFMEPTTYDMCFRKMVYMSCRRIVEFGKARI